MDEHSELNCKGRACDEQGVAWAGHCPMEGMVWNDRAKVYDYSKG